MKKEPDYVLWRKKAYKAMPMLDTRTREEYIQQAGKRKYLKECHCAHSFILRAIKLNPTDAESYSALAEIYHLCPHMDPAGEKAIQACEKALKLEPGHVTALHLLMQLYEEKIQAILQKAMMLQEKAIKQSRGKTLFKGEKIPQREFTNRVTAIHFMKCLQNVYEKMNIKGRLKKMEEEQKRKVTAILKEVSSKKNLSLEDLEEIAQFADWYGTKEEAEKIYKRLKELQKQIASQKRKER